MSDAPHFVAEIAGEPDDVHMQPARAAHSSAELVTSQALIPQAFSHVAGGTTHWFGVSG